MIYLLIQLGLLSFALHPLLNEGFFAAHDAVWHIARFFQFDLSFNSGQIPVRWAPTLFYGLGYPAFIVNFHLPYYIMEFIYKLGFNLVDTYKILLGISVVFSAIFSYIFLKKNFGSLSALVGSIFFIYSPYKFATLYSRGAIGEAVAIAFIPLVFLCIQVYSKNKPLSQGLIALSTFLLIISHPNIFVIFLPFILVWAIKINYRSIIWVAIGFLASAFQTIPALFERHFLTFDEIYKNVYLGHFPNLFGVFRLPLANSDLGTPLQVGLMNWSVVLVVLVYLLTKKTKVNFLVMMSLLIFIIGVFMMSKSSILIWKNVPYISTILFPWRLINLIVFSSSIFAAYIIYKTKHKYLLSVLLIFGVIFISRHWWGWVGSIPTDNAYYINYQGTTTAEGEFTPRNFDITEDVSGINKIDILHGAGDIGSLIIKDNQWNIDLDLKEESVLRLSILDFPGWTISNHNGFQAKLNHFQTNGLITFNLPEGNHNITAKFQETNLRLVSNWITILLLIFILFKIEIALRRNNE